MKTKKNKLRKKVYKGGTLTRSKLEFNEDYCEPQESLGCGRHALNNLLGGTYFVKEGQPITDENITSFDGKKISLQEVCKYLVRKANKNGSTYKFLTNGEPCPEDENYVDEVLSVGLGLLGYSAVPYILGDSKYLNNKDFIGFLVNIPGHWIALRKDGENYIKVDSLRCGKKEVLTLNDIHTEIGYNYLSVLGVIFTGEYMAPGDLYEAVIPTNYGNNNTATNILQPNLLLPTNNIKNFENNQANIPHENRNLLPPRAPKKPLISRQRLAEQRQPPPTQPNHYTRLMRNIRAAVPKTNRLINMRQRLNKTRKNRDNKEIKSRLNEARQKASANVRIREARAAAEARARITDYGDNNENQEINLSQFNKNNVAEARRLKGSNDEALKYLQQIEDDVKDMVKEGIKENRARIALELKGNKANAINWIKKRNRNNSV